MFSNTAHSLEDILGKAYTDHLVKAAVIIGILIIAVLSNALNLLGINSFWQLVAKGVVILLAVCVDNIKTHKRVKG